MARSKSKSRAKPAAQEVDVVEQVEGGGMGIDEGVILTTTILLAGALALVLVALQSYPG